MRIFMTRRKLARLLQLLGDRLGHQLRVEVRVLDLDHLDRRDLAVDEVFQLFTQLVDFRALWAR
jgi:hypothetical protein